MFSSRGLKTLAAVRNGLARTRSYSSTVAFGKQFQRPHPKVSTHRAWTAQSAVPASSSHQSRQYASSAPPEGQTEAKTPLYNLHKSHGAQFVPFGGYSMPVLYPDLSLSDSHNWTREKASLFDVSHMVQHHVSGPGAEAFLARITPASMATLPAQQSTLSCLLHEKTGGIVDDCVITRLGPDQFYFVTNAGCRAKDTEYLARQIQAFQDANEPQLTWEVLEGQGLIALQGPLSADILQSVLVDSTSVNFQDFLFGHSRQMRLRLPSGEASSVVQVARGGYTGEDGFEISIPGPETTPVAEALLKAATPDKLRLAGLGARDSLRLEAGMCLYGNDLDDSTTPVEGGLSWVIGKDRRASGGFHGEETILAQLKPKKDGGSGVARRRIGLVVEGAPARQGALIVDESGETIGTVTSGCPSPTTKQNIAMGYVKGGMNKAGTELQVVVRGKKRKATVTKMPFVPSKYWKGGASPG